MDAAKRAQVVQEALTWLGTPYHHHARVKGVGVDCAQLLCAVYEASGCVPHIDPGNYAHDWHLHRGEEVFIGWLEKAGAREVQVPAPGDVAVFRYGRAFSLGAVVVESRGAVAVVHAYLGAPWSGRGGMRSRCRVGRRGSGLWKRRGVVRFRDGLHKSAAAVI
jgi:cell wall-associated NlpC family hydrolase